VGTRGGSTARSYSDVLALTGLRPSSTSLQVHSMHCPEIGRSDTQVGRPRQRMIFVQMAGLLAMPTLLPEGVLSAEGEDAQAVNSS
jgi:hypothetical protein